MPHAGVPPVEILSPEIPIPVQTDDITQVVYGKFGDPVSFAPRNILFYRKGEFRSDIFREIPDFPGKVLSEFPIISLARTYALGDAILTIPLVKWIKAKYPDKMLIFLTQPPFHDLFQDQPDFALGSMSRGQEREVLPGEICINFDFNTFECDHCPEHPFSQLHRTDILYELFKVPQEERTYDYSLQMRKSSRDSMVAELARYGISPGSFILFSWRGSNPIKTFPHETRGEIVRRLSAIAPVVVTDSDAAPEGMFSHERVVWICGKKLSQALALSSLARVVVTTDSGSLWFAHITATPVVCYLGPTTEETRLIRHPRYSQGLSRRIELKDLVGCPKACVHTLGWCNREISCFHHSPASAIVDRTIATLKEMALF